MVQQRECSFACMGQQATSWVHLNKMSMAPKRVSLLARVLVAEVAEVVEVEADRLHLAVPHDAGPGADVREDLGEAAEDGPGAGVREGPGEAAEDVLRHHDVHHHHHAVAAEDQVDEDRGGRHHGGRHHHEGVAEDQVDEDRVRHQVAELIGILFAVAFRRHTAAACSMADGDLFRLRASVQGCALASASPVADADAEAADAGGWSGEAADVKQSRPAHFLARVRLAAGLHE